MREDVRQQLAEDLTREIVAFARAVVDRIFSAASVETGEAQQETQQESAPASPEPASPEPAPPDASAEPPKPPRFFPLRPEKDTGPWDVVQLHAPEDVIFICEPGASEARVREAVSHCDPTLAPFKATNIELEPFNEREGGHPPVLFTFLLEPFFPQDDNAVDWHIYLENGQNIAVIPAHVTWPELVVKIAASLAVLHVDFPTFPWNCVALPRRKGEEDALPRNMQHFTLLPEHAAWLEWGAYQRRMGILRKAEETFEAQAAPSPTAFFSPVPEGVTCWRLWWKDRDGNRQRVADVPANATRGEVAQALKPHLGIDPKVFDAGGLSDAGNPWNSNWHWTNGILATRNCTFSLADLEPVCFYKTERPWLCIGATPWLPSTRVPGYYTRAEVVAHVRIYAAPEWMAEIRAHGLSLDVQPLDASLQPVDDSTTVSLFASDFA